MNFLNLKGYKDAARLIRLDFRRYCVGGVKVYYKHGYMNTVFSSCFGSGLLRFTAL